MLGRYPITTFALFSALMSTSLLMGMWGPLSTILHEGHVAETQRLQDAFEQPLAEAIATGDDLAKIDQLHRLQKLPGVISAKVDGVSRLKVHLSQSRWQRLRYICIERIWTLAVLMGIVGGWAGWSYHRAKHRHLQRLNSLLERRHRHHQFLLKELRQKTEARYADWGRQAMRWSPEGLVLLDHQQRIVGFNRKSGELLHLPIDVVGTHWLDIQRSPEWASALRLSVDHPEEQVCGPHIDSCLDISLMTTLKEGAVDSTWIVLH